jgi:hypothetical protein
MLSTELGPDGGYLADEQTGEPEGRRLVMLYADPDTQAALTAWAHGLGFDVGGSNPHEGHAFHITLLATANDVAIPLTDHLVEPVVVEPTGFAVMGVEGDTPVMLVDAERLWELRAQLVSMYGAEPTLDFKPHVSLSYDWPGEPDFLDTDLPDFVPPLVFDRLVVQPFDPDEPQVSDGKAHLAALIRQLEGKAENGEDDDAYETERGYWLVRLDRMGQRLQASEDYIGRLIDQLDKDPDPDDINIWQGEIAAQVDSIDGILGEAAGIAALPIHPTESCSQR